MKPVKLAVLAVAVGVGLSACSDVNAPSPVASGPRLSVAPGHPTLTRGQLTLPAGARLSDVKVSDLANEVIDPDDYICPVSTPISDWWLDEVLGAYAAEPEIFELLYFDLLADLVPTYDALFFQTAATPQYFGYNGEFTKVLQKTDRDTKRFWDIPSADIQLLGMHGTMLLDEARVAAVYDAFFGVDAATAAFLASLVHDALLESEALNGGNHALFSFNAFAFSDYAGPIPDKIVMGDAVLEGYKVLGFADVAPQAIYAHEFGHHIQYENDYFDDPHATTGTPAEQARYIELMADAMSAYYLTHKRGGTMNKHRVAQFLQVFYQIGDCAFTNPGHHGTPNQRMKAAQFGFTVADQAQKQGHIMTADQFHALFVAAYPGIIAPDAS